MLMAGAAFLSFFFFSVFSEHVGVKHTAEAVLVHGVHGSAHAVIADADIVGHLRHLAGFALRSAADETYLFIFTCIIGSALCILLGLNFTEIIKLI